jgi:cholestenol delta-isomerase
MMESITAFAWGPLSFYTAYLIYIDSPSRHLFQFAVSFGQFYGDVLYYSTTLVEGGIHSSPNPFHFYFYFGKRLGVDVSVFLNAFWIVIPSMVMYSSGTIMIKALHNLNKIKRA